MCHFFLYRKERRKKGTRGKRRKNPKEKRNLLGLCRSQRWTVFFLFCFSSSACHGIAPVCSETTVACRVHVCSRLLLFLSCALHLLVMWLIFALCVLCSSPCLLVPEREKEGQIQHDLREEDQNESEEVKDWQTGINPLSLIFLKTRSTNSSFQTCRWLSNVLDVGIQSWLCKEGTTEAVWTEPYIKFIQQPKRGTIALPVELNCQRTFARFVTVFLCFASSEVPLYSISNIRGIVNTSDAHLYWLTTNQIEFNACSSLMFSFLFFLQQRDKNRAELLEFLNSTY